jgi:hypothetical protein
MTMTKSFGWMQPYVVACCKCQGVDFDFFLQPSTATRHFAALAFRGWERQGQDGESFAEFGFRLPREKRAGLLAEAWGRSLGNPAILRRLGGGIWSRTAYDHLAKVMSSPRRRAVLEHFDRASAKQVASIATARPDLLTGTKSALVTRLGGNEAAHVVDALAKLRPDLGGAGVLAWLETTAAKHPHEFRERLVELLSNRALPKAPWAGTTEITPIRSIGQLGSVGLEFRNCLGDIWRVCEALARQRCFYRVSAPRPAVVSLKQDVLLGSWHVDEIHGPGNRPVPAAARAIILARFAAAGFPHLPNTVWISDL